MDLKQLGQRLEAANKSISRSRMERDMLVQQLSDKRKAYEDATGKKAPATLVAIRKEKEQAQKSIQGTITKLEQSLELFNKQDFEALSELVGLTPTSDISNLGAESVEIEEVVAEEIQPTEQGVKEPEQVAIDFTGLAHTKAEEAPLDLDFSYEDLKEPVATPTETVETPKVAEPVAAVEDDLNLDFDLSELGIDLGTPTTEAKSTEPKKVEVTEAPKTAPAGEGLDLGLDLDLSDLGIDLGSPNQAPKEEPKQEPAAGLDLLDLDLSDLGTPKSAAAAGGTGPVIIPDAVMDETKLDNDILKGFDNDAFDALLADDQDFELAPDDSVDEFEILL